MFGYVRPLKPELKIKDFEVFQGVYCGLCHTLTDRYGAGAEEMLSYDLCFLAILVMQANGCEIEAKDRHCIASPLKKKHCAAENEALDYAADVTMILGYHKILDGIADEDGAKRSAYKLGKGFYKRKYTKSIKYLPDFDRITGEKLDLLSSLEQEKCDSIDKTADAFAGILRACADVIKDSASRMICGEILYHVGRWIYILDAWDDFEDDIQSGKYNPLIYRFPECGNKDEFKENIKTQLYMSMETAYNSSQLLPGGRFMPIIENILLYGLPSVTEKVLEGTFKKEKFMRVRNHNGSL